MLNSVCSVCVIPRPRAARRVCQGARAASDLAFSRHSILRLANPRFAPRGSWILLFNSADGLTSARWPMQPPSLHSACFSEKKYTTNTSFVQFPKDRMRPWAAAGVLAVRGLAQFQPGIVFILVYEDQPAASAQRQIRAHQAATLKSMSRLSLRLTLARSAARAIQSRSNPLSCFEKHARRFRSPRVSSG